MVGKLLIIVVAILSGIVTVCDCLIATNGFSKYLHKGYKRVLNRPLIPIVSKHLSTDLRLGLLNGRYGSPRLKLHSTTVALEYITSTDGKKILSWLAFLGLCLSLQSFFPIILQTFVFSVLGNSVINLFSSLAEKINLKTSAKIPRKLYAAVYFILLGFVLSRFFLYIAPRAIKECTYFVNMLKREDSYSMIGDFLTNVCGADVATRLEDVLIPMIGGNVKDFDKLPHSRKIGKILQQFTISKIQQLVVVSSRFISVGSSAIYNSLISLVLSSMIVWDFPTVSQGVSSLSKSRIGFAYNTISPSLVSFGKLVGKSLEVTALIALCNTILTTLGLFILKLKYLGFFALLTFVASFIPVAGIFIATFPPFVVALTEFGWSKCLELVLMVAGVHVVESYLLYPQIYALRLKLHPLLILSTLVINEHFFGLKGLFFAIPVLMYVYAQLFPYSDRKSNSSKQEAWKTVGEEVVEVMRVRPS